MFTFFLYFNTALFALFAAWCTFLPAQAAKAIGHETLSRSGVSEYPVVYGGLQPGLAIFFFWYAKAGAQRTALVLALAMHAPIVVYRCATLARQWSVASTTPCTSLLETALLVCAVALWWRACA